MPVTRRSVLRDAALLSLAGATGASPLSLLGQCAVPDSGARPADFKSAGIRIFFCGAWLFGADPANPNTRMLAATLDMPDSKGNPGHHFPQGVWAPSGCFDTDTQLTPISANGNKNHQITLSNATSSYTKVDDLFADTLCGNPFTYVLSPGKKFGINPGLDKTARAISMPFPTNIIPAAFIVNSSIQDPKGHLKSGPSNPRVPGLATAHIFEYDGATALTLVDGGGNQVGSATQNQNYHFHTVPIMDAGADHPPAMFQTLLTLVSGFTPSDLTLPQNYYPAFQSGPDTPMTVSDVELELEPQFGCTYPSGSSASQKKAAKMATPPPRITPNNQTLASCASGGGGVGNGGN
jgi:hypothetical protein